MTQLDIQAALDLVQDLNVFVASRNVANMFNIPLDIAYDLVRFHRGV